MSTLFRKTGGGKGTRRCPLQLRLFPNNKAIGVAKKPLQKDVTKNINLKFCHEVITRRISQVVVSNNVLTQAERSIDEEQLREICVLVKTLLDSLHLNLNGQCNFLKSALCFFPHIIKVEILSELVNSMDMKIKKIYILDICVSGNAKEKLHCFLLLIDADIITLNDNSDLNLIWQSLTGKICIVQDKDFLFLLLHSFMPRVDTIRNFINIIIIFNVADATIIYNLITTSQFRDLKGRHNNLVERYINKIPLTSNFLLRTELLQLCNGNSRRKFKCGKFYSDDEDSDGNLDDDGFLETDDNSDSDDDSDTDDDSDSDDDSDDDSDSDEE